MQRIKNIYSKISRTKMIIGIIIIILLGGGYLLFKPKHINYKFITVSQGPITETVSVTGNTTPVSSVSLGFGNSGNIAHIYASVGEKINQGKILAEINTADLSAQLKQAQSNVDAQEAKLEGLQTGSRPEDIAASQASLDKSEQDLLNMYGSIGDITTDSYAKANDAVRVQLDQFFSNGETTAPKLTYFTADSQSQINAESNHQLAIYALNKWQAELAKNDQNITLDSILQDNLSYITTTRKLLDSVSKTLELSTNLPVSTLSLYKANMTIALNEINNASKNLNTISQNIASQKLIISQLKAQLDLKKAGSTLQDIEAQKAQVENAEAGVQSIEAKFQNSRIIAPISGVITQFDAKVGQFTSPGTPLISIISPNSFEIDALVSETDVGKVALNNKVSMTLDAFQGEIFLGSVFYIDPAQTTTGGVVGYKIKVAFDKIDSRMKSGLTVNMNIDTRHKDNVLILPQYAILQNDKGTFVEILQNGVIKDIPVILGLQDQNGNVEIISGVTPSLQVLNIGLK